MFYNYFKIALRSFAQNKLSFALNLLGLSLALFSSIIILEFIAFEESYDTFNKNADRIFRITLNRYKHNELLEKSAFGPAALPVHIKNSFSWVDSFVRLTRVGETNVQVDNTFFVEKEFFFADSTFFKVFSFELIKGNVLDVLSRPSSIVLSESTASKLFRNTDPIGKMIELNSETAQGQFLVTGVYKDAVENSHIKPDALISLSTVAQMLGNLNENWNFNFFYNYLLVDENASEKEVAKQINSLFDKDINQRSFLQSSDQKLTPTIQNVTDIHLHSTNVNEIQEGGNPAVISFLYVVILLILAIAWVNYINLTTSQVLKRFKEVGIRKVLGATQAELTIQFLIETVLLNIFALSLALVTVGITSPYFAGLTGKPFSLHYLLNNIGALIGFLGIFTVGVIISGLYAAFVLSMIKPIAVLKENLSKGKEGTLVRKSLMGLQFSVAIVIIFISFISYKQLDFMINNELGINIDHVMVINIPTGGTEINASHVESFINEIKEYSHIVDASLSTSTPGDQIHWKSYSIMLSNNPEVYTMDVVGAQANYFSLFGNTFLAGRDFRPGDPANSGLAIINKEALKLFGFYNPQDAIDQEIANPKSPNPSFWSLRIIGVVDNFHYTSVKSNYEPLLFRYHDSAEGYFFVKYKGNDVQRVLPFVEQKFNKIFSSTAFEYSILSDIYNGNYKQDLNYNKIILSFALLAMIITCLGIFGLSAFTMQSNIKKISIRKVLGASDSNLFYILTKDMIIIITVSSIFSLPMGFFLANRWLQSFPFRLSFEWWFFLIPIIIIAIISLLTMIYHLWKAIKMSPVKALTVQ